MPVKKAKTKPQSKPLEKVPPPPARLKGKKYAIEYWKRIAAELVRIRAITTLHLEALEMLCRHWDEYQTLSKWCDENEQRLIVEYESGHMVEHPKVRLKQQAFTNLSKLWPKFGLTPQSLGTLGRNNSGVNVKATTNSVESFARKKKR